MLWRHGPNAWCCGIFEDQFDSAGMRGFGVFVRARPDGKYGFVLQHQSLEPGDEGPKSHPRPIILISQIAIHFCPWCGRNLARFYARRLGRMVRADLQVADPIAMAQASEAGRDSADRT